MSSPTSALNPSTTPNKGMTSAGFFGKTGDKTSSTSTVEEKPPVLNGGLGTPPPSMTAHVPVPPTLALWNEGAEKYLTLFGWERIGINEHGMTMWADPKGKCSQKPIHTAAVRLSVAGGEEVIKQWYGPPIPWNYSLTEAMIIQQQRERAGENLDQAIARKKKELQDLLDIREANEAEAAAKLAESGEAA